MSPPPSPALCRPATDGRAPRAAADAAAPPSSRLALVARLGRQRRLDGRLLRRLRLHPRAPREGARPDYPGHARPSRRPAGPSPWRVTLLGVLLAALWWKVIKADPRFHAPILITYILAVGDADLRHPRQPS